MCVGGKTRALNEDFSFQRILSVLFDLLFDIFFLFNYSDFRPLFILIPPLYMQEVLKRRVLLVNRLVF